MKRISALLGLIIILSLYAGCNNSDINNKAELENDSEYINNEGMESTEEIEGETKIESANEDDSSQTEFVMGENAFNVSGYKVDIEKLIEVPDEELDCMYECGKSDMALYTYKDYLHSGSNVLLQVNNTYILYEANILFDRIISDIEDYELYGRSFVDPVHYIDGDFDNDGNIELACSFIIDRGSSYMNDKLFVFDYDNDENTYNLYCLRFADFSDAVTSFISGQYDEEHIWSQVIDECGGDIGVLDAMCEGMLYEDEQFYVKWGNWENVTLGSGVPMKIGLYVSEARLIGGYYNTSEKEISCNVLYLGDGEFSVEFDKYN